MNIKKIFSRLPSKKESAAALGTFGPIERIVFVCALIIAGITTLIILGKVNSRFLVAVPAPGGTFREGIVGTPHFVNPLLATTDADKDLSHLVYRGLMRKDADGKLVPDLAESYTISDDGLTYTFVLANAYFHDKKPVTADDVLFTVKSTQDPLLKSPERIKWSGVSAKAVDEKTVSFVLKEPFAQFLDGTTLGILPKHIWESVPYENWIYSDHNTRSIVGSGLYKVTNVSRNSSGIPEYYELSLADKNARSKALIEKIVIRFYANEDALISGYLSKEVDAIGGIDPENANMLSKKGARVSATSLPRVFALFFNQNEAKIFTDASVRKAIGAAIDKNQIVNDVLLGYGSITDEPLPGTTPTISGGTSESDPETKAQEARTILEKAGWKLGDDGVYEKTVSKKETTRLSFDIATNNTPELKAAVDHIIEDLKAAGIEATAKVYETSNLNQDIIRPRKFQSLFFGIVVESQSDLFAFWHSSQRKDPGLNIAEYANSKADKLLETSLSTLDPDKRASLYSDLSKEIRTDVPAVFIYSPAFIYAVRPNMDGITLGKITKPEDRFNAMDRWYIETDHIWKLFARKQ